MKPRSEWGPADEAVHGFSTTALVMFCGLMVFLFGAGVTNAVSDKIVEYKRGEHWNKRGEISCVGGKLVVTNIDFNGSWAPLVLDLMQKSCFETFK